MSDKPLVIKFTEEQENRIKKILDMYDNEMIDREQLVFKVISIAAGV